MYLKITLQKLPHKIDKNPKSLIEVFFMKKLLLLLFVIIAFSLFAQEMSEMRVVGKAQFAPDELISQTRRDANGDICAGILIETDLTGLSFNSYNGIVAMNTKPGRYFLFVSPDERVIEIYKTGYKPLKIILNEYGVGRLKSGETWKLQITADKKVNIIPVVITCNQNGAEVFVDGKSKGKIRNKMLTINTTAKQHK